jgi:hypothetical protein
MHACIHALNVSLPLSFHIPISSLFVHFYSILLQTPVLRIYADRFGKWVAFSHCKVGVWIRAGLRRARPVADFQREAPKLGPQPPRYENLWIQRHTKLLNNCFQFYPQITAISQPSYLHQDFWIIFRYVKTGFKHQWNLYILLIWELEQPELIATICWI